MAYYLNDLVYCEKLFKKTKMLSFNHNYTAWCNGTSGLIMILSEMSKLLKKTYDLYDLSYSLLNIDEQSPVDLSVCHGVSGVLQTLLYVYSNSKDKRYLFLANKYWEKVLNLSKKNGFYTGEYNRDYILGYFLGWGGFADSSLLLKMYNEGLMPPIPLNLSSENFQVYLREDI